jgi:hypothetical protein
MCLIIDYSISQSIASNGAFDNQLYGTLLWDDCFFDFHIWIGQSDGSLQLCAAFDKCDSYAGVASMVPPDNSPGLNAQGVRLKI